MATKKSTKKKTSVAAKKKSSRKAAKTIARATKPLKPTAETKRAAKTMRSQTTEIVGATTDVVTQLVETAKKAVQDVADATGLSKAIPKTIKEIDRVLPVKLKEIADALPVKIKEPGNQRRRRRS